MNVMKEGESYNSVLFYPWAKPQEEIWQPRKKAQHAGESIELQNRPGTSHDDASSVESWTPSVMMMMAGSTMGGSTVSLESTAFSSANTTPGQSPASTPTLKRKIKPALKLNFDDVTWTTGKDRKRRSRRLRRNLQASSKRVKTVMKQSKTPQFRYRMILLTLFASIVTIVSFTWHMYQTQLLQLTIGNKIRFHEGQRVLHLLTDEGLEWVEAKLGVSIPTDLKPYHCDIHNPFRSKHMCEEWKYRAKLHINFTHSSNLSCYNVHWESLNRATIFRDCIALRAAHWYGMGLRNQLKWPLQPIEAAPVPAFVTGEGVEQMFGGIIDRYWLSSDGVAVIVNSNISLYVTITNKSLCLESRRDRDFPYRTSLDDNVLTYTICTGADMRTLHQNMMLTYREQITDISGGAFLEKPIWVMNMGDNLNQSTLLEHANRIMEHTSGLPGYIILDTRWQQQEGTMEIYRRAFPDPTEIFKILHHKGFGVLLAVHPYICLPSKTFAYAAEEGHLVADDWKHVPLLTRWHGRVCGLLDLTNNKTANWYSSKLYYLKKKYDVNGFLFTGGQTTYLPKSYSYDEDLLNPDLYLQHYLSIGVSTKMLLGAEVGFLTQSFPGFVRLTPRTVSWDNQSGLRSVIPSVLTVSILGYPLINPGSVGGDLFNETPSKELYLRWFEMNVFMPVVQFTIPPGQYDEEVVNTVYRLYSIREKYVLPVFREALESYSEGAAPLIRPLWWIAPQDSYAQTLDSQFLVGEALMVAPILEENKRSRDIYLPAGLWKDHLLQETRRGGKWLHNYPVGLTKIAYFSLVEDTTEST